MRRGESLRRTRDLHGLQRHEGLLGHRKLDQVLELTEQPGKNRESDPGGPLSKVAQRCPRRANLYESVDRAATPSGTLRFISAAP